MSNGLLHFLQGLSRVAIDAILAIDPVLVGGFQSHQLGFLELFTLDEVPSKSGRDLRHHRGHVLFHSVISRLGQVTHESQYSDPQRQRRLKENNNFAVLI